MVLQKIEYVYTSPNIKTSSTGKNFINLANEGHSGLRRVISGLVCQSHTENWLGWWHLQSQMPGPVAFSDDISGNVQTNKNYIFVIIWAFERFALVMTIIRMIVTSFRWHQLQTSVWMKIQLLDLGTFCLTLPNMAVTVRSVVIPMETLERKD